MTSLRLLLCCLLSFYGLQASAQCLKSIPCTGIQDTFCDESKNDALLWNTAAFLDPLHQSQDLFETTVDLGLSLTDTCDASAIKVSYLLFLDLDGKDNPETAIWSENLPMAGFVRFGNANTPNYDGGTPLAFDLHAASSLDRYEFVLEKILSGKTLQVRLRWNTSANPTNYLLPQLPGGKHRIQWMVESNGQKDTCVRNFVVRDCKSPEVTCLDGLSVNIMPTKMIQLFAQDFLLSNSDNCTPGQQLRLGVRKASDNTPGFPLNDAGLPAENLFFTCSELGKQDVVLWSMDRSGNTNFCKTYVLVQDNNFNCSAPDNVLKICVLTGPASNVSSSFLETSMVFEHSGFLGGAPYMVTEDLVGGSIPCAYPIPVYMQFPFTANALAGTTVRPVKDDDPLNGVSSYDLVLIKNYIAGDSSALKGPFSLIAADADRNGIINLHDTDELEKLILGIYADLPSNTAWRFVAQPYKFPNPKNPFIPAFPEKTFLNLVNVQSTIFFRAVKVGDVNGTAINNALENNDRAAHNLTLTDQWLEKGVIAEVPVYVSTLQNWNGFQLALQADAHLLTLESVVPGAMSEMQAQNMVQHGNTLRISWTHAEAQRIAPDQPLFTLRVRALETVRLSEALQLDENQLTAEAYDEQAVLPLELSFRAETGLSGDFVQILRVQPNPTQDAAQLQLQLAQAGNVRLELFDEAGKMSYRQNANLEAGVSNLEIPAEAIANPGMYTWRVVTQGKALSGKLLRL